MTPPLFFGGSPSISLFKLLIVSSHIPTTFGPAPPRAISISSLSNRDFERVASLYHSEGTNALVSGLGRSNGHVGPHVSGGSEEGIQSEQYVPLCFSILMRTSRACIHCRIYSREVLSAAMRSLRSSFIAWFRGLLGLPSGAQQSSHEDVVDVRFSKGLNRQYPSNMMRSTILVLSCIFWDTWGFIDRACKWR
jgi:hypothetical protein